jgi:hypothetical protein
VKEYQGIRYGYRPKSSWSESSPLDAILRNVTGENRRRIIQASWLAGNIENIDPEILRDELKSAVQQDSREIIKKALFKKMPNQ